MYISIDVLSVEIVFYDFYALFEFGLSDVSFSDGFSDFDISLFEGIFVIDVDEEFIAEAIECAVWECFDDADHKRRSNNVYFSKFVEEVLWPFFEKLSKGKEIEDAGMFVDDSVRAFMVIDEMIDAFYNEFLGVISKVAVIARGVEVEGVGDNLLAEFKETQLLDMVVVAGEYFFHLLVEGSVVAG